MGGTPEDTGMSQGPEAFTKIVCVCVYVCVCVATETQNGKMSQ